MKPLLTLIVWWLAAAIASAAPQVASKQAQQPDVFLVTIDTLRADHVHCYGDDGIHTPALDGLAKDGIRFAGFARLRSAKLTNEFPLPTL